MNKRSLRSIDFVIPIHNEEFAIVRSVSRLHRRLEGLDLPPWRIVIVDNGSTDDSEVAARKMEERFERVAYERVESKGRGHALRHAWTRTSAEASFYMSVDLATDLAAIPVFVRQLEKGADIVVGSRRASRSRKVLPWRELWTRSYNYLVRALFRPRAFDDGQCGFKAVRTDRIRGVLSLVENDDWFFDTELLLVAEAAGLRVRSLPVEWLGESYGPGRLGSFVEDLRRLAKVREPLGHKLLQLQAPGDLAA